MRTLLVTALLLLAAITVVPAASAAPAEPQCMQVYSRTDVGTISIVRKDSCSMEIYECPYEGAPTSQCRYLLQ